MTAMDLRRRQQARVLKGERSAATLTRVGEVIEFAYDEDYAGPDVATSLPVADGPVITAAGAVPAFFAGLLPEGRRLTRLRDSLKTSIDDELTLLLAVGGDPIGDVRVLPVDDVSTPPEPIVQWSPGADVVFADLVGGVIDRTAIPGVQEKVSAAMTTLPARAERREAIIKLNPPEYPYLVENESYFLGLARQAGMTVPRFQVIHDRVGEAALLVERFDRVDGGRLAVEDAGQVLGIYPARKYAVSMEEACLALIRHCRAQPVAARDLLRMVTFAWLTGNGDLHAKNLAMLHTADEWRISPAYDLPSTLPYGDTTSALTVDGRDHDLSRRSLLGLAETLGLPTRAAERAIDDMLTSTEPVMRTWAEGMEPFTRPRGQEVLRHLKARRRLLN